MTKQIILADQTFRDFEEFRSNALNWDLDFVLTSNNGFRADFHYALVNNCVFGHVKMGCRMHQMGEAPPGMMTFVIPSQDEVEYSWRRHDINGSTLQLFPKGGELSSLSNASFNCFVISFQRYQVLEILIEMGYSDYVKDFDQELVWEIDAISIMNLRSLCGHYKKGTEDPNSLLLKGILGSYFKRKDLKLNKESGRKWIIDLCHDFVISSIPDTIKMKDLTFITGKSERSLQYTFKNQLGISPFEYVKSVKLHRAYLDVIKHPELSITEIAYKNGFSHLGQFSLDFKKKFGVLPSTIKHK